MEKICNSLQYVFMVVAISQLIYTIPFIVYEMNKTV